MVVLDARSFHRLVQMITDSELRFREVKEAFSDSQKKNMKDGIAEIIVQLQALDMPISIKALNRLSGDCDTGEKFHRLVDHLNTTVTAELEDRKFYGPLRQYEQFYQRPKLFGAEVFNNFPSINEDITEAGTCLALERGTA